MQLLLLRVEPQPVVREMIGLSKLLHGDAKVSAGCSGATFCIQQVKSDRPRRLMTTVLPAQFIHPTLDATVKAEIIAVKREYFKIDDGTVEPV